jgi:hypothetical protein
MKSFDGKYSGAALQAFVRGLGHSRAIVDALLAEHGLTDVDPERWYDLNLARSIYAAVARQVGDRSLYAVGMQMIESAPFPPGIADVRGVLASLDAAYHMNVYGPDIGRIDVSFPDEHSASVVFTTPFPCALSRGVVQGCCRKYGAKALIEHQAGGCVDAGGAACAYYVTW